ncbi:hypothetical protein DICVIV_11100 [Dictyocaulus viviparus]|uniref:Uncharacterized protein n=1 Tax=Dictyocaulus viviparus TaxID=29172 RepID=A0A0D8XGQ7_DICVI|nr:hypothetical protein DICVIV_11100 [Dictyocaulus viviparus]
MKWKRGRNSIEKYKITNIRDAAMFLHKCILLLAVYLTGTSGVSLIESYLSDKQAARRQAMLNVQFRPLMHLRGDDDWRKQIGTELLNTQMMDENGIVYDVNPTNKARISNFNPRHG